MDGHTKSYSGSDHAQFILKKLNAQRLNGDETCDIQLKCDGEIFPAHKNILSNVSDYFEKLFYTEMQEKYQAEIEIKSTNSATLQKILDYTYSGEITVTPETVNDLLNAAHYFLIKALLDFCCDFLLETLTRENAVRLWKIAKILDLENLETAARKLITDNYCELNNFEEIYSMDLTSIKAFLEAKPQDPNGEKVAFRFALDWVKHDMDGRRHLFPQLFKVIDLDGIDHEFLAYVIAAEDLVVESLECLQEVAKQLKNIYGPRCNHSILILNENSTTLTTLDVNEVVEKTLKLIQPRRHASFLKYNDYMYMVGGLIDGALTDSVVRMDLRCPSKGWEKLPSMSKKRRNAGLAVANDMLFAFGGYSEGDSLWLVPENIELNTESTWLEMTFCKKSSLDLATCKGILYALHYGNQTCERCDPEGGVSKVMHKLPEDCVKVVAMNDQLYMLCQDFSTLILKTYDPESGQAEVVSEIGNVESFRDACSAHGEIVVSVTGFFNDDSDISDGEGDIDATLSDESEDTFESDTVYIQAYNFTDGKWRVVTDSYELTDYWKFVPCYSSE